MPTLERFERSNASEIRNGIMFDFYPGLPQMDIVQGISHEGKKRTGVHLYEMMALTVLRDEHVL